MKIIPPSMIESAVESIKNCKECGGKGFIVGPDSTKSTICECQHTASVWLKYNKANIPTEFLRTDLEDYQGKETSLTYKKISKYISELNKAFEICTGLYMYGSGHSGKKFLACCILKAAIRSGFDAFYMNFDDMISLWMDPESRAKKAYINNVDFLCLADITRPIRKITVMKKGILNDSTHFIISVLDEVLNSRALNGKPTIVTVDRSIKELEHIMKDVCDHFKNYCLELKCGDTKMTEDQSKYRIGEFDWNNQ